MKQFETTALIDENVYMGLKKHRKSRSEKIRAFVACAVFVILGFLLIYTGLSNILGAFIILVALLFPILDHKNFRRTVKLYYRRTAESSGGATVLEVTTSFSEEEIKIHNHITGSVTALKYDSLVKFVQTERLYIMITKENQFVVVDKLKLIQDGLNEDFLSFIKEKCNNVKWRS